MQVVHVFSQGSSSLLQATDWIVLYITLTIWMMRCEVQVALQNCFLPRTWLQCLAEITARCQNGSSGESFLNAQWSYPFFSKAGVHTCIHTHPLTLFSSASVCCPHTFYDQQQNSCTVVAQPSVNPEYKVDRRTPSPVEEKVQLFELKK